MADVYNVKPDLTRYAAMGHKLIMYHGWADQQISPYASIDFYQRIVAKLGQAKADAFLKFYMLPGIYHCAGGPGTGNFGAAGPASAPDARHDITMALDEWVTAEEGARLLSSARISTRRPKWPTAPGPSALTRRWRNTKAAATPMTRRISLAWRPKREKLAPVACVIR